MQIGDKVQFQIEGKKYKSHGTVININGDEVLVGVGEKHYFNYEERLFPRHDLYVFHELSYEDFDNWVDENFPNVYELAKEVFAKMLPEVVLKYHPHESSDASIEADGYGITLDPCVMEVRSIGRVKQIGGYSVSRWFRSGGSYMEPPEVDQDELGEYSSSHSAVCRFAEAVFGEKIRGYFDAKAEEEYAKEYGI
jgi:hypothetical protein